MTPLSAIETLEARIAPAITIIHPLLDINAGIGEKSATIDLAKMVDSSYRTKVEFITNYKLPGKSTPAKIVLELFDDKAPVSVQNFLQYLNDTKYDGTFFHRTFDFGSGSEAGTDIIQGGGFTVWDIFRHITTDSPIQNEYNASDPELQNTRGTIAMAKVGGDPNSATSEWFFNLTNNSTILGADNNGGFTVFGKITEGMDVVDAIGKANKENLNGALTDLPVQKSYKSGTPKTKDLFEIVDARVISSGLGNADGYTFSNIVISNHALLDAAIDPQSNQLKLTYKPGATGTTDVTLDVSKDGETTTQETFHVTIKPNLITQMVSQNLPTPFVSGDTGLAKVKVINNTGGLAKGNAEVRLYLSEVKHNGNNIDPLTFAVDPDDQLVTTKIVPLNLQSGKSVTVPVNFTVQYSKDGKILKDGIEYVIVAETVNAPDGGIDQLFTDDDSNALHSGHVFALGFGKVNNRKNVSTTINGPNGDPLTFSLKGAGTGKLAIDAQGHIDLTVLNTNSGSTLSVKTAVDDEFLDDVNISSTIGSVKLAALGIHGHFAASGGAVNIALGDLGVANSGVDRDFSVNAFPNPAQKLTISVGDVHDFSLYSGMPIGKLIAGTWLNDSAQTAPNQIFAPSMNKLQIAHDLEADVNLSSDVKSGSIIVGGTLRNVTIQAAGNINVIQLGNIVGSDIFVGVTPDDVSNLPKDASDFKSLLTIGKFTVTGNFADSAVAASHFNSIMIANVDDGAGTDQKGIFAEAIKSYVRGTSSKLTNLDEVGTYDSMAHYAVHIQ